VTSTPGAGAAVDEPPTDLLIITSCYLTIVKLYKVLFDDILDSMADAPHTRMAFESALRGLRIGGFDLSPFGCLSMAVLGHTAVHVLDQIENALYALDKSPFDNRAPSETDYGMSRDNEDSFPFPLGSQYHQHSNLNCGRPQDLTTANLLELLIVCAGGSKMESMNQGGSLRTKINSVKTLSNISLYFQSGTKSQSLFRIPSYRLQNGSPTLCFSTQALFVYTSPHTHRASKGAKVYSLGTNIVRWLYVLASLRGSRVACN
jgi:hypothetical protein